MEYAECTIGQVGVCLCQFSHENVTAPFPVMVCIKLLWKSSTLWRKFPWFFGQWSETVGWWEHISYTSFTFNQWQATSCNQGNTPPTQLGTQYFRGTVVTFMTERHGVPPASHSFERKTCWFQSGPPWRSFKYIILLGRPKGTNRATGPLPWDPQHLPVLGF